MFKLNYNSINIIEIELTNKCTLKCIHCPRNDYGKDTTITKLDQTEISLSQFKSGFNPEFIKQLKVIYLCGTYGDPIHNTDLLRIIEYIRDCSTNVFIDISTHGNTHSGEWWNKLASIIGKNSRVSFAIDGLHDTYSIYRNVGKFDKVISNMKKFINNGGNARWSYIVFKHNQHQVTEARDFAKSIGVNDFFIKRTSRFIDGRNENQTHNDDLQLINKIETTNVNNDVVLIEPPTIPEYIHPALSQIKSNDLSIVELMDISSIDCLSFCRFEDKTYLYVDTHGTVTPCGYIGGHSHKSSQLSKLIKDSGGYDKCNIFLRPLLEIINDDNSVISKIIKTWNLPSVKSGKLKQCSLMCGSELNSTALNKLDRQ